jgi:SAM-dependent methyltransferase
MDPSKELVRNFWEKASCGEALYLEDSTRDGFLKQSWIRYQLEPYIVRFAEFEKYCGKKVLEIGIGLGADHQKYAETGAELYGIDLTQRAVNYVRKRFAIMGTISHLSIGDVENLAFADEMFDLVYSWGVIHHTPDAAKAAREILRVLKRGGEFKVMVYHKYSLVGYMLWVRYALMKLRPLTSLAEIYGRYLESPGTKAFTTAEAQELFKGAAYLAIRVELSHGDLLNSLAGQRHRGILLTLARIIWPRFLFRNLFKKHGLFMLIHGKK